MKKTVFTLSLLQILMASASFANPIEETLEKSGIRVAPKTIAGINAYEIGRFSEAEKNRNHYDTRNGGQIQSLVMHYTACDFDSTMKLFTQDIPDGRVSAHYVITQTEDNGIRGGELVQVVPEAERSWHAGVSFWRGVKNLNATSIGIENVNRGFVDHETSRQWFSFDTDQMTTLGRLSQQIISKYQILPQNVVGHSDIAPARKQDPGILFPWERLYSEYGVGAWLDEDERTPLSIVEKFVPSEPLPHGTSEPFFLTQLGKYGYEVNGGTLADNVGTVLAFKSHFSHNQNPKAYTATIDETDMLWAWGLAAKYK